MIVDIRDNFLSVAEFELVKNLMLGNTLSWYYNDFVSDEADKQDDFYFTHQFYAGNQPNSPHYQTIFPIVTRLDAKAIIRIKGNLYPNVGKKVENSWHNDYPFPHKGAVFYVNTNDGYTELDDGTIIESKENRILLFDPSVRHRSVQCTDEKTRVTINMNYF